MQMDRLAHRFDGFCRTVLLPPPGKKGYFRRTFVLCFVAALLLLGPYWAIDGGLFHYAGDFNSQQITFYQYANRFVKEGGSFSWVTDLGSGFVNSYSFYLLGSPFFWLSCLFPAGAMPFLMVPFLALKFAVVGSGAYLWLRRYTRTEQMALLGGVLYAFSGFNVYNIFFNHFLDVTALFPFLLWALDKTLHDDRKGLFAPLVALNLINSYFFFAGQVVFLAIYFACKIAGGFRCSKKKFARLAFESLLGCAMGCLLAWPAVLSLMNNPRTVDPAAGYGLLLYGSVQQYFAIFFSFFLPPDPPYFFNLFHEGILRWTSMSGYLPFVGCVGGIAWLRARRGHPFTRILLVCLVCAFVPVLNSAFYLLNSSYYARWWYMPVLILCAVTVMGLEQAEQPLDYTRACNVVWVVLGVSTLFALVPVQNEEGAWQLGVVDEQALYWPWVMVAFLGVLGFEALLRSRFGRPDLPPLLLGAVLGFTMLYGNLHIAVTKFGQWETDMAFKAQCYVQGPALGDKLRELAGEGCFFRCDSYECYDNLGLWTDVPFLRFFNSTVAPSIMEFYPAAGVKRDVSSKPEQSVYALRGLLSVRYLVMPQDKQEDWAEEKVLGYQYLCDLGDYAIYENKNYLPMGFAYDRYLTPEQAETLPANAAANILLKALILDQDQIDRYGKWLQPLPDHDYELRTYNSYTASVRARRTQCCERFAAEKDGFTAAITLDSPRLVFFSVPWESGFTAEVNGQETTLEKVSNGMMAVFCPAGHSEIRVTYHTAGLAASGAVTAGAAAVYAAYLAALVYRSRKKAGEADRIPDENKGTV